VGVIHKIEWVVRMILAPVFLGVVFAAIALGHGPDALQQDRAYFGFASVVSFAVALIGIWIMRWWVQQDRRYEGGNEDERAAGDTDTP
jgi:hypothetical protein